MVGGRRPAQRALNDLCNVEAVALVQVCGGRAMCCLQRASSSTSIASVGWPPGQSDSMLSRSYGGLMGDTSPGGTPALLPVRAAWLLLALGLLFVGFVLTTTGAGIITAAPVVPVSPSQQQQPTTPPDSSTETTETTEETTTEETTSTADTPTRQSPDQEDTEGQGEGGIGGAAPTPGRAQLQPVADEVTAETQINVLGAMPMWIGIATQLIGLVTAVFSYLAARSRQSATVEGQAQTRVDRRRRT